MSIKDKITSDLTEAMKAKDAARVSTLRMVKANLMNRQIEKGNELTDEEVLKALQSLVKQRRDSIEQYEKGGRPELAAKEAEEIRHIEKYLPQAASEAEIEEAISAAVSETGAASAKDIGPVIKTAIAKLAGKTVDAKVLSEKVKRRLSNL
ncbi:MAG: glutamyl-tRNA amidotransferase [Blastocatellia bacterium]